MSSGTCSHCGADLPEEIEPGTGVYCDECGTGQHVGNEETEPIDWDELDDELKSHPLQEPDPLENLRRKLVSWNLVILFGAISIGVLTLSEQYAAALGPTLATMVAAKLMHDQAGAGLERARGRREGLEMGNLILAHAIRRAEENEDEEDEEDEGDR